ncbi:dynactin subunit 1 isoform X2 [Anthonomus grandis grandis]|uniref:dynactin subunit 1 isoform X2 n=1 Tax=Anthonomus grandis grandis TaxID=2921223 RepID=UPI002164FBE1|nr:dynactin subunit 1 isoform X2 [Anthonomus grandis grandis]
MADLIKVGQRVEVGNKGDRNPEKATSVKRGVIAFIGKTNFQTGKWIGVVLEEPKGKNDGTVEGVEYFKCDPNHGIFVRESQVTPIDKDGMPIAVKTFEPQISKIARSRTSTGMKTQPTLISLGSSRHSLAGSRQSLAGSRQSLAGSRSHLASPATEKPPEGGSSEAADAVTSQIPKRASFVETGFVETLKPQFTPGAVITTTPTPVTSMEEKISYLQLQQELENRSQQIKDLGERIETLKIRRQEDKERLKDYDKLKIQLEQLIEFKSKIMEAQNSLQRELQRAKQEAKEAIEAREAHAEEVADLAEAVEMATLDKEMAEEKVEVLQAELEACKEKLEEVTLDLQILKTEMEEKALGTSTGVSDDQGISAYEMKQLQQQNARLRETLVKLRDLSAHDKHEYQKLIKEMDQKQSEITELGKTKEKLSSRLEDMERQVADLQEQVDAALGAEEMVVILGEQKLTLEEKVAELEEEVRELEALQDMNDQLVESNAELEADLREELDMAMAAIREAKRERDAALETIADRESTINKFRGLVQQLQDQSINLQAQLEKETSKPIKSLPEIVDFKKMFTETKAHTKAIDLELRSIDVQQLQQHIKYLSSYMPDSFMNRGGDHDAVLVLLLIPRLIHKSEILLGQIKDKFPTADKVDRAGVLKGHVVEQYSFRCRMSYFIFALQTILHQYYYSLNTCKPETLLKVGSTYPEMAAQEKIVDGFVDLVKRDQLDENVSLESLEKCFNYFKTLYPVLLGGEEKLNQNQLSSDYVKLLLCAVDGFSIDAAVVRCLSESGSVGDICLLAQHVISTSEQIQQQLKLAKRRLPTDVNVTNLGLDQAVIDSLSQCYQHAGKILKTMYHIAKPASLALATSGENEKGLSEEKLKEIAMNASDRVYQEDDLGPIQSIKASLALLLSQTTAFAKVLQDNEAQFILSKEEKPIPPITTRAETVKKELEQTKTLTSKLENKESDIKELKKLIKEKQEQLSEMTIRKELAEKKLGNVNNDYKLTIEKLQRKLEEAHNYYKKKEKEFEETLDHLQTDIDSLENEKGEMKEKMKLLTKKAQMETSLNKNLPGSAFPSMQSSLGPNLPAVVKDSPMLVQEIETLRKLFHKERNDRIKLQNEKLKQQLDSLAPLPSFKSVRDEVIEELFKEGATLKQEILMSLAKPVFPAIYKVSPEKRQAEWIRHFAEEQNKMAELRRRSEDFQNRVAKETVKRKYGGRIDADFDVFPTRQLVKAMKETEAVNIGFIKIPKSQLGPGQHPGIVNLDVDLKNLQTILQTLC